MSDGILKKFLHPDGTARTRDGGIVRNLGSGGDGLYPLVGSLHGEQQSWAANGRYYAHWNEPYLDDLVPYVAQAVDVADYIQPIAPRMTLPVGSSARKEVPLFEGAVAYFPAALALMARVSKTGNDKHNPGEPLHHARGKSMDHSDCVLRHLVDIADIVTAIERGKLFNEPGYESVRQQLLNEAGQFFWRAGAFVQELCEKYDNVPMAPNARKTPWTHS